MAPIMAGPPAVPSPPPPVTGITAADGALIPTSAAYKRIYHVARGYRYSDMMVTIKHRMDTTVPAADYAAGVMKRLDDESYLYGFVNGGVGASLGLRRAYPGGDDSLYGAALPAILDADVDYWLRLICDGNDVRVEHWDTEPTPMGAAALPGDVTLAGAAATAIGENVAGEAGIYWVPGANYANARITGFWAAPYWHRDRTLPDTLRLRGAIPGDAPALCDLEVTPSGGAAAPVSAVAAFTRRPPAPLSGSVVPFGVIEGETGGDLAGWVVQADAGSRGGLRLAITTSGAGTASATFAVDPSSLAPEDFSEGELSLEIWAVMVLAAGLVSPRVALSSYPLEGTAFGAERFADEGSIGRLLTKPSAGTVRRPVRLGTLRLPTDPRRWKVKVAGSWLAASAGVFGLDYLWIVPAASRLASPTGMAAGAGYPAFAGSTAETTRVLRADGSGAVAAPPGNAVSDRGLGKPIELPAGEVDLFVKLSSLVADDPTANTTTEQLAHNATVHPAIVPRSHLVRP